MYSSDGKPLFDALVTSYEFVQIDKAVLQKFKWSTIVSKFFLRWSPPLFGVHLPALVYCLCSFLVTLEHFPTFTSVDEAHRMKKLDCNLAACLKRYCSEFRLLLTVCTAYLTCNFLSLIISWNFRIGLFLVTSLIISSHLGMRFWKWDAWYSQHSTIVSAHNTLKGVCITVAEAWLAPTAPCIVWFGD